MWKFSTELRLALVAGIFVSSALACGPWLPPRWLAEGGSAANGTPEFYWELEVRRIAAELTEKPDWKPWPMTLTAGEDERSARVAEADLADYRAAVAAGKADDAHTTAHQERRQKLQAQPPGELVFTPGEDHEFADYHRGAAAYLKGNEHHAEAQAAWEKLLARPAAYRQYRSTWAAFMLGKLKLSGDLDGAAKSFQQVREMAAAGFADSLNLAADSIGWEAFTQLGLDRREAAAVLYLQQLALGDESAVTSLRQTLPFIRPADGADPEQALKKCAASPLIRRLNTARLLSGYSPFWRDAGYQKEETERWLAAIEATDLPTVEDAEYLGWLAYSCGHYDEAQRWLDLSSGDSAAAHWLRAKLLRRAGQLAEAAQSLSQAVQALRDSPALSETQTNPDQLTPFHTAGADLGGMQLERGEFLAALDAFREADMQLDTAYLAERVLTPDELKAYVEKTFTWTPELDQQTHSKDSEYGLNDTVANEAFTWRWMLGRRLVRGKRFDEARPFLPAFVRPMLDAYGTALKGAQESKRSRRDRAQSWFDAAILARHDGFQLMATEVEPDAMVWGGSFDIEHIANERANGEWSGWPDYSTDPPTIETHPVVLKVTTEENQRLAASHLRHEQRFHYRYLAAEHAVEAAKLLPDQSEELADVLNTAGGWLKVRDPKAADPYIQQIERRAWKTNIGQAVAVKHWFVEIDGPWSTAAYAKRGGRE